MDYRIESVQFGVDFADPDGNTWVVQERGFTGAASTSFRRRRTDGS